MPSKVYLGDKKTTIPNINRRKESMNNRFDELTKSLAQSVTRRAALKKFGVCLAGMVLAAFGLANTAMAAPKPTPCATDADCGSNGTCCSGMCYWLPTWCDPSVDICCCDTNRCTTTLPPCSGFYFYCVNGCANGCHKKKL
jgi:hypothetical protein